VELYVAQQCGAARSLAHRTSLSGADPVQLALVPLVGAIAAGNCFILKPSEVGVHCERAFREVLPRYLDNDCFAGARSSPCGRRRRRMILGVERAC